MSVDGGSCPSCRSARIRKRYPSRPWECRACKLRFDEPLPFVDYRDVQRAIDQHPAESPFWVTAEGQQALAYAVQHHMRPAGSGPAWAIRFAIRRVVSAAPVTT